MEKFFETQTPIETASQKQTTIPIPTPNTIPNTSHNTTPSTIPNTILNIDPTAPNNTVIIQDDNAPIQLKSPKKEGDVEPPTIKRKPTRNSDIWDHFTKIKGGDAKDPRCTCNYCGVDYACHSRRIGTSSLWAHFHKCKKNPHRAATAADKKQKVLSFHRASDGGANLLAMTFNKVRCRNALAKFVVKDEQAFRVVEGEGFKEFINELQPKFTVLGGEYLHVRCGAHIVNLIVNDGLTKLHDSIAAIRNSVRYIRASPARLLKFRACVEKERIDYKGGLILDVVTRWNSTYMMLDVALKFEKAFARYEEEDDKFLSFFMEKENGKKMIGPPTSTDWESASIFVKFLSTFYDVTLKFSGTLHVTSNNFYHEICEIHSQLTELADANDPLLSLMAVSMKEKYDKYWGTAENINPLLFLAVVLDPRYKMKYLKYCFESVYDSETVARIIVLVESVLQKLYNCYNVGPDSADSKDAGGESPPKSSAIKETRRRRLLENYLQQQQMQTAENKNDVDKYLAEEPLNPMTSSFDILFWWKENSSRYKILSLIAKDVLAIPVSTVASEAAFSTSGRILDPFRSSLSPKMLEVLVCTQSWLKEGCGGMKSKEYLDEIQSYQFLEEGDMDKDKGASNDKMKTKIVDVIDD